MGKSSRKNKKASEEVFVGKKRYGSLDNHNDTWLMKKTNRDLRQPLDKESPLYNPVVHILLIVLFGLLVYSNTFHSPFQWDETDFISENPFIKNLSYFMDVSKAQGFEYYGALKSRYIGYLTFALNYRVHGFDVAGYHVVNILIHIINSILVYFFVSLTFRTPFLGKSSLKGYSGVISLFTALFFVVHPIQIEAVTYIFQRLASLVSMFYLISIVMYIKDRLEGEKTQVDARGKKHSISIFYFLSIVSAVLAMKTKENAFTLPIVITIYEFLFFRGPLKPRILRLAPLLLTMLIIPLTLIGIDKPAGEIMSQITDPASLGYQGISREAYLITQFRVIVTYIRLLFLPINQNIDYDYPVYQTLLDPKVFPCFLFLLSIASLGVYLVYRSRTGQGTESKVHGAHAPCPTSRIPYRLIAFGIFWFFISISVESSIIPIPMVIDEYRVYLPSVGLFTAMITAIFMFVVRPGSVIAGRSENIAISMLVSTVIVLSIATYARNTLWTDKVSLWQDVISKSPNKPRGYNNLGLAYFEKGQYEKAIENYDRATALNSSNWEAYTNRGFAFSEIGQPDKAIADFDRAIALNPRLYKTFNNKGMVYGKIGALDKAIEQFNMAIDINPSSALAYSNRGLAHSLIGEFERALKDLNKAIELDNNYAAAYGTRGNLYLMATNNEFAIQDFQKACDLGDKEGCNALQRATLPITDQRR